MSLWSRIKDLFRANANAALDSAEDPVKMADEYIRQLDAQYVEAKKGVAETMAMATRLGQKRDENRRQAADWEQRAANALGRGDEQLARAALGHKRQYAETASEFAVQYETQEAQVRDLRAALARLEQRISEARAKRDLIKAKSGRAQSQEAFQNTMRGAQSTGQMMDRIDAMEEKVDDRLNQAEAMAKLETNSLESRFSDLERDASVDQELALLKQRMSESSN